MALTDAQKKLREGKVTASFIPYLMAGSEDKIAREWQRLTEHPDYVEEDLSANWPVQFGSYVEPFALDWHEMKTGEKLTRRGEWIEHPCGYVGCTLDAWRESDRCVIDNKAPTRWRVLDDVLAFYPGQLVVQKACMQGERAALLVVHGGDEPTEYPITWDAEYEDEVWRRIGWFWACVESLQPPYKLPPAKSLIPAVRVVDMTGNNSWADFAGTWLKNKPAYTAFNSAAKGVKSMMEDDVAKAFGHGICATRSRAGSVTIKAA